MGLDAAVMCNCFPEGKTTEPPCPRDWLVVTPDGCLDVRPEHGTNELGVQVDAWKQTPWPHPGLDAAHEWIASSPGYRSFQQALDHAGWDYFPVLRRELPSANG